LFPTFSTNDAAEVKPKLCKTTVRAYYNMHMDAVW